MLQFEFSDQRFFYQFIAGETMYKWSKCRPNQEGSTHEDHSNITAQTSWRGQKITQGNFYTTKCLSTMFMGSSVKCGGSSIMECHAASRAG